MSQPSQEAHERIVALYHKALHDLNQAEATISRLTKTPLGSSAVACAKLDVPGHGKQPIIIGIVQCPRCGQHMEVEK